MALTAAAHTLALAASNGDAAALSCLYETFAHEVRRRMLTMARGNHELANDLASNAWEQVALSIRNYQPERGEFEPWLMGVSRRAALSYLRSQKRTWAEQPVGDYMRLDAEDHSRGPAERTEQKMMNDALWRQVGDLAPAQGECLRYRFKMGLSIAETAQRMNKGEGAVKQLQFRALDALRARMQVPALTP